MTNFEKIKSLTLGEMADFLEEVGGCGTCSRKGYESCQGVTSCRDHILEYLESEEDSDGV